MDADGVGCVDKRCQNNEPKEFGLNRRRRQVFCNREQKWGVVWKIENASSSLTGIGKEKKQGYVKLSVNVTHFCYANVCGA